MAVTVNNGTQTPVVGAETTIATIAGGPFDDISVYFTGGTGGSGGAIGVILYATVNGVVTRVASQQVMGSAAGTLIEFADTSNGATGTTSQSANQNTSFLLDAGASTYTVKVIDLSTAPLPPGGSVRQSCTVTLAGVNTSDTAADTQVSTAFAALVPGTTGTLATLPGYNVQMDVAASLTPQAGDASVNATVSVLASNGPGSVSATVASLPFSGTTAGVVQSVFRNLHLPVATTYTVQIQNTGTRRFDTTLTAITYTGASSGGGGGAIVLAGEVTGPSNANIVTGPFATASLAWQAAVIAPTWTQLQNAVGAGQPTAIVAQSAAGGSGGAGGALLLQGGLGDGGGAAGSVEFAWGSPAVVRALVEPTHGRITAGGGGGDFKAIIGPDVGAEGTNAAFWILAAATAPTANNFVLQSDGSGLIINTPAGGAMSFDLGLTNYLTLAAPGSLTWATGLTASITQAAAAGAGGTFSITGQAAGGAANDGGPLALAGGAHAGASKADGSVKITTPANMGYLTIAAASPLNLTNAQSNNNVFLFTGAPPGGWQVNFLREIADTSLIFVKNTSTQTMTVSYLTGGTVIVATNTSALIASDGANLQKIMTAT